MKQILERLHEASLQILETTGIKLFHPEILRMVQKKGVKVIGQTAFFSPNLPKGTNPDQELLSNINKKKEEMLAEYCPPKLPRKVFSRLKEYLA